MLEKMERFADGGLVEGRMLYERGYEGGKLSVRKDGEV